MSFRELEGGLQCLALEIMPPDACQLSCKNCYKDGKKKRGKHKKMPTEFAERVILQAKECGFRSIVFIGGEPTLHSDLPYLIERALGLGLNPIVVTNGYKLANELYAKKISLPGVSLVMHAPLPEDVQDEEVQLKGYSKKLKEAFNNLLNIRQGQEKNPVRIVAEVVVIKEFAPYIPDMLAWCRKKKIEPFIEFNRNNDFGQAYEGSALPEEVHDTFRELRILDQNPQKILVPPAYGEPCTMSITGLHVKNFGEEFGMVSSCCAQSIWHGDLRIQSLREVLSDPSMKVFKEQDSWIFGPCKECEYYSYCRGGCRGQAYQVFNCPRASCPACWHIPKEKRNDPKIMAPSDCSGCPLEGDPACGKIKNKKEIPVRVL